MTGTELHNNIDDLWAYVCLLQIPAVSTYEQFCSRFKAEGSIKLSAVGRLYLSIAMRRTKGHEAVGAAGVLPERVYHAIPLEMNTYEMHQYNTRLHPVLQMSDSGSSRSSSTGSNFLSHLIRLRQVCSHELLTEEQENPDECQQHSTKTSSIVRISFLFSYDLCFCLLTMFFYPVRCRLELLLTFSLGPLMKK